MAAAWFSVSVSTFSKSEGPTCITDRLSVTVILERFQFGIAPFESLRYFMVHLPRSAFRYESSEPESPPLWVQTTWLIKIRAKDHNYKGFSSNEQFEPYQSHHRLFWLLRIALNCDVWPKQPLLKVGQCFPRDFHNLSSTAVKTHPATANQKYCVYTTPLAQFFVGSNNPCL